MDRRMTVYRAIAECRALDTANDVLALSQEGRLHLERAYQAHIQSDWSAYLHETDRINRSFLEIRDTARRWVDDVVGAPAIDPNQLPLRLAA